MKDCLMKLTICYPSLLFLINVISFETFSQQDSLSTKGMNDTVTGKWAVQVEESKYSGFTYTTDMIFICKKYLSSNTAIRGGFSILGLLNEGYNDNYSYYFNSSEFNINKNATSLNGAEIFIQYIYYPVSGKALNMFIGCGPEYISFTRNSNDITYEVWNNPGIEFSSSTKEKVWGLGASLSLGVEWFPVKRIGITAEYGTLILVTTRNSGFYTTNQISHLPVYASSTESIFQMAFSDIKLGVQVFL